MESVALRAMTEAEYWNWLPGAISDYAEHHTAAGSMPADRAQEISEKQFADLLPEGVTTPEQHLLIPEVNKSAVGLLWLNIPDTQPAPSAFIYDIEVNESMRGRGLGRAVLVAGETFARQHGAASIRLHVFGDNTIARHLYDSLGYNVTNVMMSKPLDTVTG